jgi:chemotaxis family two-component system response regulator Rcp1
MVSQGPCLLAYSASRDALALEMDPLPPGDSETTPRSGLISILLVEDSAADAELTREVLQEAKVRSSVQVVRDGAAAMAFLRGPRPPDLVLLDLNLPGMDGREILAQIKTDEKLKHIPVVVLSASPADEDVASAYANQANAYIRKPTDLDGFVECVRLLEAFWLSVVRLPPR